MRLRSRSAKIYVAGHRGLVGSAVVRHLEAAGYANLAKRTSGQLDLRDAEAVARFFEAEAPEYVVLAAARAGGILAHGARPYDFIRDNLAIELNVIHAAHEAGVKRLVFLGSACAYPRRAPQPMAEEHLLTGPLEPTVEWYAVAKIAGMKLCQALRRQHGRDFVTLLPTNLYGPGDNFDPETSHVLAALVRKFHEARRTDGADAPVTLWGSGTPRREFLYSEDLAGAVAHVLERPEDDLWQAAPDGVLNVGAGEDIEIRELAALVRSVVGGGSTIEYDRSKPDGAPRKLLEGSRMQRLGWQAQTPLQEGIERLYAWYLEHEEEIKREETAAA